MKRNRFARFPARRRLLQLHLRHCKFRLARGRLEARNFAMSYTFRIGLHRFGFAP